MEAILLKALEEKKHTHVAYIRPDGTGITSKNNGHTHEIAPEVIETTSFDEMGNPVVSQQEGGPKVVEAENHTHELGELKISEVKDKVLSDEDEVNTSYGLYKESFETYEDSRKDAEKSEDFVAGDQWKDSDRQILKAEQRACVTVNETKPKLDMLSGHFRQNRTDITLSPTEEGDAISTDIYNILIKNIQQQNNYDHQETYTFENQSRVGLGFMEVYIDAENSLTGEVKVTDINWKHGFVGVHKELDGSDSEYAGKIIPISKAKLKELYPDKADDIEKDFQEMSDIRAKGIRPSDKSEFYSRNPGVKIKDEVMAAYDRELLDIAKKEYKLIKVQRRVYKRTPVLFNSNHDFYFNAEGISKKDLKDAESIEELNKVNSVSFKIRETEFAGKTLLSTQISLFKDITIVPFYANKIGEKWWGKIKEAMPLQEMLNKLYSQAVDIINKCARYGIGVTSEAFESKGDFEKFVDDVNKPGFVAKFAEGFKAHLHEFQGVKYPSEITALMAETSNKMNVLLNVYPEMMGQQGRAESGVAIAQKLRQGLIGNEYLYDNHSLSKRRVGQLLVKAIQIVYSPEKILRVVERHDSKNKVELAGQALYPEIGQEEKLQLAIETGAIKQELIQALQQGLPISPEDQSIAQQIPQILEAMQQVANDQRREQLLSILGNHDITKYDATVTESTQTATMMLSNYILLSELAAKGVPIPPTELIQLMPNLSQTVKDRMISGINQSQQAQAESEQKKFDTEIQKTLIAAETKAKSAGIPSGLA